MKKTIAKIMAAAMVLSAVPAVALPTLDANAAKVDNGSGIAAATPSQALISKLELKQGDTVVANAPDGVSLKDNSEKNPLKLNAVYNYARDYSANDTVTGVETGLKFNVNALVAEADKEKNISSTTILRRDTASADDIKKAKSLEVDPDAVKYFIDANNAVAEVKSDTSNVFDGISIDKTGQLTLGVNYARSEAQKVLTSGKSYVVELAIPVAQDWTEGKYENGIMYGDTSKGEAKEIKAIDLWVEINGSATSADSTVKVEMDNNESVDIPVTLQVLSESGKTVKIIEADPGNTGENGTKIFTTDAVKGGNLILNTVTLNGTEYKIERIGARVFKGGKFKLVKLENAKRVNNGAFRECKQLKKVIFNDGKKIKKVDSKAFYKCKKLATVKIGGKALKQVGKNAFGSTKSNIIFKIGGNKTQVEKAKKLIKKSGVPKKAKYAKI